MGSVKVWGRELAVRKKHTYRLAGVLFVMKIITAQDAYLTYVAGTSITRSESANVAQG